MQIQAQHNSIGLRALSLLFIDHVLKTDSLQNIILSLASIIKTSQNAIQRSSTLILKNILENFHLCHYQIIKDMTQYMNGLPNTFKKKCNAKYEGNNVYKAYSLND